MLHLILSRDTNGIIGINNQLLVKIKQDLQRFRKITVSKTHLPNAIVMGYNTWKSLPVKPLPERKNIIITKNHSQETFPGSLQFCSVDNFMEWYSYNQSTLQDVFIIGGETIYNCFMKHYSSKIYCIYLTEFLTERLPIHSIKQARLFTHDLSNFIDYNHEVLTHTGSIYDIGLDLYLTKQITYTNTIKLNSIYYNSGEHQYLQLLQKILQSQNYKETRNGGVYSLFGLKMEFDLTEGFPLLTTKKMGWKTILRELLWFLSGSTNNQDLKKRKVHIWNQNADDFSKQKKYKPDDLGPVYGFQWRHFGANYDGCDQSYETQGVDQIHYVINEIKTNPNSRRILLSAWNPVDIPNMALPPCHVMVQFYVRGIFLDAQLYQRSGDMFLGVPFNIASYSFLLTIIASLTGYKPGKFIHILGDAHIYEDHEKQVETQLERIPYIFPKLTHKPFDSLDTITESLFSLHQYQCHESIKAPMIT